MLFRSPSTNTVRVSVTDGVASVTNSFTVVVREVNVAPVFATIVTQTFDELTPLSLTLSATDADIPVQTLAYTLVSGPSGMTITSAGALAWTPTEAQGPSTNTILVSVTDGVARVTNSFTVVVREVNVAPVLAALANQSLDELEIGRAHV